MAQLCEKYRPRQWAEVLGQEKVCKRLSALEDRAGLSGRAYWISGGSGTGKTTLARIIAAKVADEFSVEEFDSSELTADRIRAIRDSWESRALFGPGGRAYIVNEAHGLRADAIRRLLVLIEGIPPHCVFVFTTTAQGQADLFESQLDASPLLSRCIVLELAQRDLAGAFAARALEIARAEGLDGKELPEYVKLVRRCKNNMRAVLQEIDSGAMLD